MDFGEVKRWSKYGSRKSIIVRTVADHYLFFTVRIALDYNRNTTSKRHNNNSLDAWTKKKWIIFFLFFYVRGSRALVYSLFVRFRAIKIFFSMQSQSFARTKKKKMLIASNKESFLVTNNHPRALSFIFLHDEKGNRASI